MDKKIDEALQGLTDSITEFNNAVRELKETCDAVAANTIEARKKFVAAVGGAMQAVEAIEDCGKRNEKIKNTL